MAKQSILCRIIIYDRVKYIVNHCTNLINDMKDEVLENGTEIL